MKLDAIEQRELSDLPPDDETTRSGFLVACGSLTREDAGFFVNDEDTALALAASLRLAELAEVVTVEVALGEENGNVTGRK